MTTSLENEIRDALFGVTQSGTAVDDALSEIMEIVDRRRPARSNDYELHGKTRPIGSASRPDTQANEIHGLTPKPLDQQVPGAWNFIEPNPNDPPAAGGSAVLNVTSAGHEINLVGALEESLIRGRQGSRRARW